VVIYAATNGYSDNVKIGDMVRWEQELLEFLEQKHPEVTKLIVEKGALTEDVKKTMVAALDEFKAIFKGN
jgi:F-type H+-transporting ATPase subunit alpha